MWGFPEDLCEKSREWLRNYFEDELPPAGYTRKRYNDEGRELAKAIKALVGPDYKVTYRYILRYNKRSDDLVWKTEVI